MITSAWFNVLDINGNRITPMPTFRLHLVLDTGEHCRVDTEQPNPDAARRYARTLSNVAYVTKIKLVRAA